MNKGHLDQSRSDYIRALGINVRAHGRDRPLTQPVAITLSNIAGILLRQEESERVEECIQLYEEVVKSFETTDSQSWMTGNALCDLAECLLRRCRSGDIDEAKSLITRALHIFLITRGSSHPSTDRAAALLQQTGSVSPKDLQTFADPCTFVDTLIDEAEKIVPKKGDIKVSGDILFLDRRGHVGHGHPHSPLF
jgi:hypothetical protein